MGQRAPQPGYFPTAAEFREWLARHHETDSEILVGLRKKGSGKPSITWQIEWEGVGVLSVERAVLSQDDDRVKA